LARWDAVPAICAFLPLAAHADPAAITVKSPPAGIPPYSALAPRGLETSVTGWAVQASVNGRAVDLDSPGGSWTRDPMLGPTESQAGMGWRGRRAWAVVGYADYDRALTDPSPGATDIAGELRRRESGVIGLNLVLRTR